MKVAAVDIGTNSVLLLVAERRAGVLEPLLERATITRLGAGVDRTRRLDPAAAERTLACLADYARSLAEHGVERLDAVGTSALRDASGGELFLDAAARVLGVRPRVISGAEEAELTFHGALSGLALRGSLSVFDVGGGSTEIIHGTDGPRIDAATSLDLGSVRAYERHVRHDPIAWEERALVIAEIDAALAHAPAPAPGARLVGVAGTVTTLAALDLALESYDPRRVHGYELSVPRLRALAEELATLDLSARRRLRAIDPARADVIVCGAAIVERVAAWAHVDSLIVSDRGVRWGLAERLSKLDDVP